MNSISTPILKRLLLSHNLYIAGRAFFEIFMGVYIWTETHDLTKVAWFFIVYLFVHTLTFSLFAGVVKKGRMHFPRKLGIVGFTLVYFVIFALGDKAIDYIVPIAVGIGFFNGLYWISYHIFRFDYTEVQNRGNYTGLESALNIIIGIVIPTLGGFIIVQNFGGFGYANIFLLGSVFYIASLLVGNIPIPEGKRDQLHLRKTFTVVRRNKDIMKSMYGYALGGLSRTGSLIRVLLPLLIFDVLQNEFHLGGWLSFFSAVAIFLTWLFGKFVNYKYYKNFITYGGLLFLLSLLSLIGFPVFVTYILFGMSKKLVDIFIAIPKRVISENLIHQMVDYKDHRIEYIVIREWFGIGFGRLLSYILLFFASGLSAEGLKYVILIMAVSMIVEIFIIRSIKGEHYGAKL